MAISKILDIRMAHTIASMIGPPKETFLTGAYRHKSNIIPADDGFKQKEKYKNQE